MHPKRAMWQQSPLFNSAQTTILSSEHLPTPTSTKTSRMENPRKVNIESGNLMKASIAWQLPSDQSVACVLISILMNIQIYLYQERYKWISKYICIKNDTNEYPNIFVYKMLGIWYKRILALKNIWLYSNIQILVTPCCTHSLLSTEYNAENITEYKTRI